MYEVIGTTSSRAFRVVWLLEELGVEYTYTPEKPRSELVSALNPSGKIPVLREGELIIPDSSAIITYLADKHGAMTFAAGTPQRAQQDSLTHLVLDELDAVLWTAARHSFILPEEKRVPEIKSPLKWEYERNVARLSDLLQGPYLMGEQMTIADIIATHCLNWAFLAKFPAAPENLTAYTKAMRARPAYKRAVAIGQT